MPEAEVLGDVTRSLTISALVGGLAEGFKRFVACLNTTIGKVRDRTATIATASSEIASGNQDLSARTETQASSLEQTASAMEQLTATVTQNAENPQHTNQLVQSAAHFASEGGAVVASKVRTLAQRSAGAAKEIKELISDSVQKVDAGSKLVDEAGATMSKVVSSVQQVTGIMGEIVAASREQSAGIAQVNLAVTDIDRTTQQNAALVEQAANL